MKKYKYKGKYEKLCLKNDFIKYSCFGFNQSFSSDYEDFDNYFDTRSNLNFIYNFHRKRFLNKFYTDKKLKTEYILEFEILIFLNHESTFKKFEQYDLLRIKNIRNTPEYKKILINRIL